MDYALSVRIERLKNPISGRAFLLALDATLFSGPVGSLIRPLLLMSEIRSACEEHQLQGILAFQGFFRAAVNPSLPVTRIVSATASTERDDPRAKAQIATVGQLIAAGADAIGIHLTIGHPKTPEMLSNTGRIIAEAHSFGLPALVASYVQGSQGAEPRAVVHAASIARDLGADVIKLMYPGSVQALRDAVDAGAPAITVLAGGERKKDEDTYYLARQAVEAGAGICFGRSIFEADSPSEILTNLAKIVHER